MVINKTNLEVTGESKAMRLSVCIVCVEAFVIFHHIKSIFKIICFFCHLKLCFEGENLQPTKVSRFIILDWG